MMKSNLSLFRRSILNQLILCFTILFSLNNTVLAQEICRSDTSFTDILFLIDNSQSIDEAEYDEFSDLIMATITKVQQRCVSSQIGIVHYGGAFGEETAVEFPFSRFNVIPDVQRQFCTNRNQFNNCQEGGGDDLNHAIGEIISLIDDGTLNRNPVNKLALVIFTDAFGFDSECTFINCSVIRPFTNIDLLKSQYGASVTVVGASMQAEASLLAIYASPGGSFDKVQLFQQDCPSTFDGCTLPRKYIPIEFSSPIEPTSDSISSCVTCTVEIIGGVTADAGEDQSICEGENTNVTLSAQLFDGTPPYTYNWDQGLGSGNNIDVSPLVTTTYSVTITDNNGCSSSDAVTIIVEDCTPVCQTPPIIYCPADTILCPGDDSSPYEIGHATALPGDSLCLQPDVNFIDSTVVVNGCLQIVYRHWTASYPYPFLELTSSCVQVIEIKDETAPVINNLPNGIIVDSDDNCRAIVNWDEPMADDNCEIASFTATHTSGDLFELGITYVIYTATDVCNNVTRDSFPVEVRQQCCIDGPIINCPPDYYGCPMGSIDPELTGMASASASSSFCGQPTVSYQDQVIEIGLCEGSMTIRRTWTALDTDKGLYTSCDQLIILSDTVPPRLLECPPDITLDPDNPTHEWDDPRVDENCGFRLEYSVPNGSTFTTGETRVMVTAIDMCGNTDTCSFVVTVPEEVMIICPDVVLRCLDTLTADMVPMPEVSSNCDLCQDSTIQCIETTYEIDSVVIQGEQTIYTITYFASDLCNTDSECTTEIIIDNSAFLECPDDITVQAPPYGFLNVEWEEPVFQTCCNLCIPKNIPGYLYMGEFGGSYYYCSYARVNWKKAERLAKEAGGNLASISSQEENDFISRRLIERHAYIGLSDEDNEGQFAWVDGTPFNFSKWKPGEPDNKGNEDFVEMTTQGYWYDVDGSEKREFVIEIDECIHVTQVRGPENGSRFRVGTTTISYVAADGCGNIDTCSFDVIVTPYMEMNTIAEVNIISDQSLIVFPNPANSRVNISSNKEISTLEIFFLDGRMIDRVPNVDEYNVQLDVSSYAKGLHFVKVGFFNGDYEIGKLFID